MTVLICILGLIAFLAILKSIFGWVAVNILGLIISALTTGIFAKRVDSDKSTQKDLVLTIISLLICAFMLGWLMQ